MNFGPVNFKNIRYGSQKKARMPFNQGTAKYYILFTLECYCPHWTHIILMSIIGHSCKEDKQET